MNDYHEAMITNKFYYSSKENGLAIKLIVLSMEGGAVR